MTSAPQEHLPAGDSPTNIGWIGLGDQGAPMARAIAEAGFTLHVWARRLQSLDVLAGVPHVAHDTLSELAAASEAIGLCLRLDSDIHELLHGAGLLDSLEAGTVLVNHGTGLPGFAVELSHRAAARGVAVLDAPVSGGRPGAEDKALTTIVGGDPAVLDRMRPVFESFSKKIAYMGPAGSGQLGKLVNNALLMMNQQNVQLVLRLADDLRLDTPALIELLLSGTGSSFALQALGTAVTSDSAEHLSQLQVIDMELFDEAVASLGVPAPEISARAMLGAQHLPDAARRAEALARV